MNDERIVAQKYIAIGLWVLLALFSLRVLGQLLAYWFNSSFLPPFSAWYSGSLNYNFLLISQFIIIGLMIVLNFRFTKRVVVSRPFFGQVIGVIGLIYFIVMFARLGISLFKLSDQVWFNRPIPSFFHLVLASYLMLVAKYHLIATDSKE